MQIDAMACNAIYKYVLIRVERSNGIIIIGINSCYPADFSSILLVMRHNYVNENIVTSNIKK